MNENEEAAIHARLRELKKIIKQSNVGRREIYPARHEISILESQLSGCELLTVAAIAELYDLTLSAIRKAITDGRIDALFELKNNPRPSQLVRLSVVIETWGTPKNPARLAEMRAQCLTMGINGIGWNVLHTEPLLSVKE